MSPWSLAALSLVEIQSWFLVSSGAEFEIFFPLLLVISEKKTGRFPGFHSWVDQVPPVVDRGKMALERGQAHCIHTMTSWEPSRKSK